MHCPCERRLSHFSFLLLLDRVKRWWDHLRREISIGRPTHRVLDTQRRHKSIPLLLWLLPPFIFLMWTTALRLTETMRQLSVDKAFADDLICLKRLLRLRVVAFEIFDAASALDTLCRCRIY